MTHGDIAQIGDVIGESRLVGLGESTHGTHEFFVNKFEIFKQLVTKHGFNTMLFEDNQQHVDQLNKYIKGSNSDPQNLIRKLYPVWRTQELLDFLEWMRDNSSKYQLNLIGFDIDQSKVKPEHRDKHMAEYIKTYVRENPQAKCVVWAHNFHISKTKIGEFKTMGYFLHKWFSDNYYALAQLFGLGEFNATIIDEENHESKDRALSSVSVESIPEDLLEHYLDHLAQKELIIETDKLSDEQTNGKQKIRSIGWSLAPSKIDMCTDELAIAKAYDAVIYCPKSSRSMSLQW